MIFAVLQPKRSVSGDTDLLYYSLQLCHYVFFKEAVDVLRNYRKIFAVDGHADALAAAFVHTENACKLDLVMKAAFLHQFLYSFNYDTGAFHMTGASHTQSYLHSFTFGKQFVTTYYTSYNELKQ